jgi:hypothetical protein
MDGNPFYVNFGINGIHYTKALVDSGCLCFATISLSLARRLRLPRISITPRDLEQVNVTVKGAIREVAYADTDIDGHKLNRVFFYVIPDQEDDVILGRPWMNAEEVTISPSRGELTIGTSGLIVKERSQGEDTAFPISQQMSSVFGALVRKARKDQASQAHDPTKPTQVFAASLKDIEKALAPKKHTDPRLPRAECHYPQGPVPSPLDPRDAQVTFKGEMVHEVGRDCSIPQDQDQGRRRVENSLPYEIRALRVAGYPLWLDWCPGYFPTIHQPHATRIP